MAQGPPKYEFFVSRAGADAAVAREVADVLRQAGHTVKYQDEDIPFGSNFIDRMNSLIEDCAHLVVILSPAYLASPYCREEWTNFLANVFSAERDQRRIVVLLAEDCRPPGILRARVFGALFTATSPVDRREVILAAAEGRSLRVKINPPIFEGLPARNPNFCGREAFLKSIGEAFNATPPRSPLFICGQAGTGKSAVAAEYAYAHAGDYWGAWQASAESRASLVASLAKLGARIDPKLAEALEGLNQDLEGASKAALAALRSAGLPWLLIYDNATNPDILEGLLSPANAHILVTTRWSDWAGQGAELDLGGLTNSVAKDFLILRSGSSDEKGAVGLAETLGNLPLALDQAGAFCRRSGLTFDEYRERMTDFIRLKPMGSPYPTSIFATFNLGLQQAASLCPAAGRLISLIGFLAPDQIKAQMFDAQTMDVVDRTLALEALSAVSLVQVHDGAIRAHRLTQAVARQNVFDREQFAELRPALHGLIKRAFDTFRPTLFADFWEHAFWALYYDPDPKAALGINYDWSAGGLYFDLSFDKAKDRAIEVTAQIIDTTQLHYSESRYQLVGGAWKRVWYSKDK